MLGAGCRVVNKTDKIRHLGDSDNPCKETDRNRINKQAMWAREETHGWDTGQPGGRGSHHCGGEDLVHGWGKGPF